VHECSTVAIDVVSLTATIFTHPAVRTVRGCVPPPGPNQSVRRTKNSWPT
jgi:hypothetical protein